MRKKQKDEYKPVRIMDLDAWDIVFHSFLGVNLSGDFQLETDPKGETAKYKGSIPASLDCFQIWKVCKLKEDNGQMLPFLYSKESALQCSDALINVSFPRTIEMETLVSAGKKAAECLENIEDVDQKKLVEDLKNAVEDNQNIYNDYKKNPAKKRGSEIKKQLSDSISGMYKLYLTCINAAFGKKGIKGLKTRKPTVLDIRKRLYNNGFYVDTVSGTRHYVMYKRSASKAKTGACLFIWDKIYDDMMEWTWMGLWSQLKEKEQYDLTSLKAYEALVLSSISGKARIKKDQILLIESVESPEITDDRLILVKKDDKDNAELLSPVEYYDYKGKDFKAHNKIWDGQALVDRSVFEKSGYVENGIDDNRHGMMLLRNKFFKACAFNANIQDYYRKNEISTVTDMFGRELPAKNIRMIVTLDSLKFVDKFADCFFSEKDGKSARLQAYEHWLSHIDPEFGIVKEEEASNLGNGKYHEISYQILNTLPLTEDDMNEVIKEDLRYLDLFRNNEAVILYHMENVGHSVAKTLFFSRLYKYFKDFEKTYEFRDIRRNEINRYIERMRRGRIKIRGDFYVLCSMPVEMLRYSADRDKNKISPILERGECCIKGVENAAPVTVFRYPHISPSGVCSLKNVNNEKTKDIFEYLNLDNKNGSNIIIISPWDSNIMVRLGGADFDSDTVLFCRNETIEQAAGKLTKIGVFRTSCEGLPIAEIDEDLRGRTQKKPFTRDELAELDNTINVTARNVGELSNDAQIFNAYFWEEYFKGKYNTRYLEEVYKCSLKLSVLNELEIDRAKHSIKLDIGNEIMRIREKTYNEKKILVLDKDNKRENPYFLYISKKKKNNGKDPKGVYLRESKYWNCPVDYISKILDKRNKTERENPVSRISLSEMLDNVTDEKYIKKLKKPTANQLNELYEIIKEAVYELEQIPDHTDNDAAKREDNRERIQSQCLEILDSRKISAATVFALFKRGYEKYKSDSKDGKKKKGEYKYPVAENSRIRNRYLGFVLSLIDKMIEVGLIRPDTCRKELVKGEFDGDNGIEIWGEKFKYHIDHPEYINQKIEKSIPES